MSMCCVKLDLVNAAQSMQEKSMKDQLTEIS